MEKEERIVALIDMDCFYVQVVQREQPHLKGKPVAVLQYSDVLDGGSSVLAVGYEARSVGVKRGMRGKECLELCPEIQLVTMPHIRAKADLTMFKNASNEVMTIFAKHATIFERASIDEAFIDITANIKKMIGLPINISQLENTFIAGSDKSRAEQVTDWADHLKMSAPYSLDYKLSLGAIYVDMIRREVFQTTGFTCSAGIGCNKIIAKLAAGTHKPNSQTLVSPSNFQQLYEKISFTKIRNFGGKLGSTIKEELGIDKASELIQFTLVDLIQKFGEKTGTWIYNIARGIDDSPVKPRTLVKQTACSKNFPKGIFRMIDITKWIVELSDELSCRLLSEREDNKRIPTLFSLHLTLNSCGSTSIQISMSQSTASYLKAAAIRCLEKKLGKACNGHYSDVIYMMSLAAGKFISAPEKDNIATMLKGKGSDEKSSPWLHKTDAMRKEKKNEGIQKMFKSEPEISPIAGESSEQSVPNDAEESVISSQDSVKSVGFFDNYKNEADKAGPSTDVDKLQISESPSKNWNTLSEAEQRIMLQPLALRTKLDKTNCPVCSKAVLESKLSEHLDFHTALNLQREIESAFRQEDKVSSPKRPLQSSNRSNNKKAKICSVKSKNIASFFKKR